MPAPKKPMNSKSTPAAKAKEKAARGLGVPYDKPTEINTGTGDYNRPRAEIEKQSADRRKTNLNNMDKNLKELERRSAARSEGKPPMSRVVGEPPNRLTADERKAYKMTQDARRSNLFPYSSPAGPKIVGPKKPSKSK